MLRHVAILHTLSLVTATAALTGCGGSGATTSWWLGTATPLALVAVAPEPALAAGVDPVPALSATPMRVTGTDFPVAATPSTISLRLTSSLPIFADGTSMTLDIAATASTDTTIDFVTPLATLSGVDSAVVDLTAAFPDGGVGTLVGAFTYQAPALAEVSLNPVGTAGATGIANANLEAGGRPLHLFARGGGDPFVLSPAAGRTFGPLPVPAAGTVGGVVDVEFRTASLPLWPGNAEFAIVPGTLVSDGAAWLVRGSSPALLEMLPAASTAPVEATVSVTFEDGTRQTLPATGVAPGAQLVRTSERLFTVVGGLTRAFGQTPGADGVSPGSDGGAAGTGPLALDAPRNRLYVANGATIEVFDTAQTLPPSAVPALGPTALAPGAPSPRILTLPGAPPTGLAVDPTSGRIWAVNDLGVHVLDPFVPGAPVVTLAVPPGLGATNHAQRALANPTAGEMVVSLFDGAGAGTEALLVYDAATASIVSIWRVGTMPSFRATIARNAASLGSPTEQIYNDGSVNGNQGSSVAQSRFSTLMPAPTGAVWNGEIALRPGSGAAGRAFLLYDNTGNAFGTVLALNVSAAAVNGVPVGIASGVSISIPSDWVHALDLNTGGSTAAEGLSGGAYALGAGALLGAGPGASGAIAYDPVRDAVVVHAAATGGDSGFAYVNYTTGLGLSAPSGPPYSSGTFNVNGSALVTMITNATTPGLVLNTPSGTTGPAMATQDHLRVLSAPGAVVGIFQGSGGASVQLLPPFGILGTLELGPARGMPQTTAAAVVIDSAASPADGNWYLLGAPAPGDLTEARFLNPGVSATTSAGVGPVAPGPAVPVLVVSAP